MDPGAGERLDPKRVLRLSDLALVVGEDEVGAPTMDVDAGPEIAAGHGRALDVPPRSSGAERRLPGWLVGPGLLPEHEIERITLVRIVGGIAPLIRDRQHLAPRDVAQFAELGIAVHRKIDIAGALVGMTFVDQVLDDP